MDDLFFSTVEEFYHFFEKQDKICFDTADDYFNWLYTGNVPDGLYCIEIPSIGPMINRINLGIERSERSWASCSPSWFEEKVDYYFSIATNDHNLNRWLPLSRWLEHVDLTEDEKAIMVLKYG